jgi:hypothetical protein
MCKMQGTSKNMAKAEGLQVTNTLAYDTDVQTTPQNAATLDPGGVFTTLYFLRNLEYTHPIS